MKNKKAYFEYFIEEEFNCGVILFSSEVKSIQKGDYSFADSYCYVDVVKNQIILKNLYVKPFAKSAQKIEERRDKVLLLNKTEIRKIKKSTEQKGFTLVPLEMFIDKSFIKFKIGVAKGKKLYDKRETIKKRELERSME